MKIVFSIEEFKNSELDELSKDVSLNEGIDYKCKFITVRQDDKIIGVAGVNFNKETPRLEHIIVSKKHQGGRLGVRILRKMEDVLRNLRYSEYYSYILNGNERMKNYAIKWKMQLTKIGERGSWYTKRLEMADEKTISLSK